MLVKTINDFFYHFYGRELTEKERSAINSSIEDHGIDTSGQWLIGLFEDLQGKKLMQRIDLIQPSYPNGDNGFSNLLADLQVDFGFDLGNFEDYGEGIQWTLDRIGIKFFLSRESSPGFYIVEQIKS